MTLAVAIGIDYYIATKIAGGKGEVWEWFALLLIIPSIHIAQQTYDSLKIQKYI